MEIKGKLRKGGILVLEVPNANDLLLNHLQVKEFKDFTLWGQHLILHTRESLNRMLKHVGFNKIMISGVQRYSLSNHLYWLKNGAPGGHKSILSCIDTTELQIAYSNSLAKIDATDTLLAIAEV